MNAFYRLCLPGNRISVLALSRVLCSFTSHLKRRLELDPPNHINLVKPGAKTAFRAILSRFYSSWVHSQNFISRFIVMAYDQNKYARDV